LFFKLQKAIIAV
jgi:hypothetical protein